MRPSSITNDNKALHQLEVQDATTGEWNCAGPVHFVDGGSSQSTPIAARRQLPKRVKQWLAPNATSKEARRPHYLYRHAPNEQPNTNLLILLHGAGDTHLPFDKLAHTMVLPQTATLAISASRFHPLPFGLGYSWFQEMDYATGEALTQDHHARRTSLDKAVYNFAQLLTMLLYEQWIVAERIFFMGYGSGATLIMELCQIWNLRHADRPALGGGICIGGGSAGPPADNETSNAQGTPILLLCGAQDKTFPLFQANETKLHYEQVCGNGLVTMHVEPNKGQGMISTSAEMHAVMAFLASRLVRVSRMGT
jgi:predicted esterase